MKRTEPKVLSFKADVEITAAKASEDGKESLPTFEINAYNGGPMTLGGFYHPVVIDVAGAKASERVVILRDHDPTRIVGQGTGVIGESIDVKGTVMSSSPHAQEVVELSKNGFKWQASVGMSVDRREFLADGKKTTINGREVQGPLILARETTLVEVSFVPIGADSSSSASIAANSSKEKKPMSKVNDWIAAKGFDPDNISDEQREFLEAAYNAEQKPQGGKKTEHSGVPGIIEATRKENARQKKIADITATFCKDHPYLIDQIEAASTKAIEDGTDPDDFELEMLRATRGQTGVIGLRKAPEAPKDQVIEAALCQHLKIPGHESRFDDQTLQAAHTKWRSGLGLKEFFIIASRAAGVDITAINGAESVRSALRACFGGQGESIRASGGFSTINVAGILSNVANKALVDYFNSVEMTWRKITAVRPVSDFKTITSYSLTGDLTYEEVGPGGEIPHGTLGEDTYTNQAKTYGKMLAITRQDIINDDLGAFAAVPRKLGLGGARKINDVFWTEFCDNASFFTSGRGNYSDADDTALSDTGLAEAVELWNLLTDPDGGPLGQQAKYLLVPPALWSVAQELMTSINHNTGGSSSTTQVPNRNIWAGMFEVVMSQYLQNTTYQASFGDTIWYLLGDPMTLPVIETCFLGGQEMPTVESADADFDVLGVKFRAYHDFGVTKQEYRAGIKLDPSNS